MSGRLKEKIISIADGKLSEPEIEEIVGFIKHITSSNLYEDEQFFKEIAYEMTGSVKELALLVIDFRRDIKTKVHPELNDLATKYIHEAADQLEGIIETTENAANKIMDNLDLLQEQTKKMEETIASLKSGKLKVPGNKTDFILEGTYDVWTKVNKGELDGGNAIMQRQLQFKGNMSNIIRYSKSFLRLFQLMQKVPVEY